MKARLCQCRHEKIRTGHAPDDFTLCPSDAKLAAKGKPVEMDELIRLEPIKG